MAFGVTSTGPLSAAGLKLQSLTKTPRAYSTADALDEYGDVAARAYYGGSTTFLECSATYTLEMGTVDLDDIVVGAYSPYITSLEVATSNSDWPTFTVSWREGLTATALSGSYFTLPAITVKALRVAQNLGAFTVTNGKLNSCSVTFSCDFNEALDAAGNAAAWAFSNGVGTASCEVVTTSATVPTIVAGTGWTLEQLPGTSESNTAWATTQTVTASRYLTATAYVDPTAA